MFLTLKATFKEYQTTNFLHMSGSTYTEGCQGLLKAGRQGVEEEGQEFLINTTTDNQLNYAVNLLIG